MLFPQKVVILSPSVQLTTFDSPSEVLVSGSSDVAEMVIIFSSPPLIEVSLFSQEESTGIAINVMAAILNIAVRIFFIPFLIFFLINNFLAVPSSILVTEAFCASRLGEALLGLYNYHIDFGCDVFSFCIFFHKHLF